MNLDPTQQQPTLEDLINQGKDKFFLAAKGFDGAEIEEAIKKKSTDDLLIGSSTGLSSVDSLSESQSLQPDADLLDWAQGHQLYRKTILGVQPEARGGALDGFTPQTEAEYQSQTAGPGQAFAVPSLEETKSQIQQASAEVRSQITADEDDELDFLGAPKRVVSPRVVAFGRGKDTYEKYRALAEGPAASAVEYRQNARAAAREAMVNEMLSKSYAAGPDQVSSTETMLETLIEANKKNPEGGRFMIDALTDEKLLAAANKDEGYIALKDRNREALEEIETRLKEDRYTSDLPASTSYGVTKDFLDVGMANYQSAADKRQADEQALETLKAQIIEDHNLAISRQRRFLLQEAFRLVDPKPEILGLSAAPGAAIDSSLKHREWAEKMKEVEHLMYKGGIPLDIDDDGYIGETNSFVEDRFYDLQLMTHSALDLAAAGVGGMTAILSGDNVDTSGVTSYFAGSAAEKDRIRSQKSTPVSSFLEESKFGSLDTEKAINSFDAFLGSAIESLPFTGAALTVGAFTKSPAASVATMSYLAGAQTYFESKLDSSFDSFSIDGEAVPENLRGLIQPYYMSGQGVKTDEKGDYIVIKGQRIDVVQGNSKRWGYATALGFAEGAPEAIGAHILLGVVGSIARGGSTYTLDSMFQGAMQAYGRGARIEFAQEMTTEFLTIMSDAAIKGEYIDPVEAFGRVVQAGSTGAISGGGMGSTLTTIQRGRAAYRNGNANSKNLWERLSTGYQRMQDVQSEVNLKARVEEEMSNVAGMDKAKKAAEDLEKARESEDAAEISAAEQNLAEALIDVETENEALKNKVKQLIDTGTPENLALAETIMTLSQEARALETVSSKDASEISGATSAKVAVSGRARNARLNLEKAVEAADKALKGEGTFADTESLTETAYQPLLELEEAYKPTAQEMADAFGKPIEEVQEYLDKVSAATAYAAMSVGNNVRIYENEEEYLKAVPNRQLAERLQTSAQYDTKTGTIHLSPNATVFDVVEERLHGDIRDKGLTDEELDEMAGELLESKNETVKDIAARREQRYEDLKNEDGTRSRDMNEEIVVGVMRETREGEFQNENLKQLSLEVDQKYGQQRLQAQVEESGQSLSVQMEKYGQMYRDYSNAGVADLDRRYGKEAVDAELIAQEPEGSSRSADEIRAALSYNDVLDLAENMLFNASTDAVNPGFTTSSRFGASRNPALNPLYEVYGAFEDAGLLEENGRLKYNIPVLVMSIDNVGNTTIEMKEGDEARTFSFQSGMDAEAMQAAMQAGGVIAASTNQATATRFLQQIIEHLPKKKDGSPIHENFVILYKNMGRDAATSNVTFFARALQTVQEKLANGDVSVKDVKAAIIASHEAALNIDRERRSDDYKLFGIRPSYFFRYSFQDKNGKTKFKTSPPFRYKKDLFKWRKENGIDRSQVSAVLKSSESFVLRADPALASLYEQLKGSSETQKTDEQLVMEYLKKFEVSGYSTTNKPTYFSMSINQRSNFLGTPQWRKVLTQKDGIKITEEIQSPYTKYDEDVETFGMINGMTLATLNINNPGFGKARPQGQDITRNLFKGEVSQYSYGVSVNPGAKFVNFSRPLAPELFQFSKESIERSRNQAKFANEIVDTFSVEEAKLDRQEAESQLQAMQLQTLSNVIGAAIDEREIILTTKEGEAVTKDTPTEQLSSRFMGMPDKPFTMNYVEEVVNSKGTWSNGVHRQKTFQDGWHFWNWWVLQTGNGKVDKLGGWGYVDENGAFRRLGNIPKKKDRQTGEVLDLEPLFRSNQQRQIDANVRDAGIAKQRSEQKEADFLAAEQALKEKLDEEGSDYSYSVLANGYGTSEFDAPGAMGGFNNRSAETVRKMDAFYEVSKKIKNLQPGEKTAWMPSDYSDASQVMEGMELVTLAGRSVNLGPNFSLGKLINFRRERQFLEREEPNLVYSVENIDGKYVARMSIAVSSENMDLIEEFRKRPKPRTRQEFLDAFEVFREGEIIDDSDAKSARFMPPRYYQLKEERGAYQGTIDFLNTWMVNKYADVIGLQDQIEQERGKKLPESQRFSEVEQLMYGRARQAMDNLEVVMQDARAKMKEFGLTHSEVSEFMYALHARERNAKILKTRPDLPNGSGMTDERAEEILSNNDSPQMREVVKMFSDLIQDTRNTMVEMGLETQQRIDAWNELYENYVPLQGFAEDELDLNSNSYPTGGAGMSVYGSKTKAAIGRESEAANVLANIVMQNAVTHQWAEKNRTLQAMHELVKKNPQEAEGVMSIVNQSKPLTKLDENGKQVAMTIAEMEASPNTVAVRIDGKQEFIYFNDPYYASVLSGMTMENSNTFIKMMRGPVGWLRGVFTQWDPNFFVSNFARDMGGSVYNAAADLENGDLGNIDTKGFQKEMMGNSFKFLKALLRSNAMGNPLDAQTEAWVAEWKESGGQTGWNYIDNLKDIEEKLMVLSDNITRTQALKDSIFGTPKKFFGWVEGVNEAFENSIRLSAYVTARNRGASEQQAAVFSKNITVNFNRSGEAGPILNSVYLFFNAAIQGNLRVYNSVAKLKPVERPDGTSRKFYERATNAQKIGAGMAGFSGMLTLLNIALSGKDPEDDELWYNKISDYDKSRNMIICYGPNRDDFLKIPLPYGYGLFNNMGMALAEVSTGNRSINSAINLLGTTAFTSFSPISFGGIDENPGAFVLRSFAPTVVKPFVEMAENKTYFGAPVTGEQLPFGTPVPQSQLSFRSPLKMQEYFEFINEATGGSQFKSGWADFNPDYGWYLFEYMVGGSGQFILQSGEQARNLYEMAARSSEKMKESNTFGEAVKAMGYGFSDEGEVKIRYNKVPIVKKLYGEASPFYDVEKFKENQKAVKQLNREIVEGKTILEPGRYNGIQALYKDLQKRDKLLKAVRKNIREARDIENYIDRQNRIFDLYETQRRIMAEWNYKYEQARGED